MTDTDLSEQCFNIAWSVLERTGELGEPDYTSRFLFDSIASMMRRRGAMSLIVSGGRGCPCVRADGLEEPDVRQVLVELRQREISAVGPNRNGYLSLIRELC
jgi:hypothetical protein